MRLKKRSAAAKAHSWVALFTSRYAKHVAGVEEMLRPLVAIVIQMEAPLETEPMLTAVR